jgi:hypothetical protein
VNDFWFTVWKQLTPDDYEDVAWIMADAEHYREKAKYNTGSMNFDSALALRALSKLVEPEVVVEVGTFIGVSTRALRAERIYTCDFSNDCLPATQRIKTFPHHTSTQMLQKVNEDGELVDLFFFDGRLDKKDRDLIQQLSTEDTVYAFDDYEGTEKGWANVNLLKKSLPDHVLVEPRHDTTLALLIGREWL